MSKRNYNVFFNTHTVSGIVISVALYTIFFAGAFALFKDEIAHWEKGVFVNDVPKKDIDYDSILVSLKKRYYLVGRNIIFRLNRKGEETYISLSPSKDSLAPNKARGGYYFSLNTNTYKTKTYTEFYSLGEFLYRLHFFSQLPRIGLYLSGLVSFFFLFAMVTGTIMHWRKIIPAFYSFNPKRVLKRVWTEAHTVLGVIGLPFQFVYAVTGAYFGLSILALLLPTKFLSNSDRGKLIEDLRPESKRYSWTAKSSEKLPSINDFVLQNTDRWKNFDIQRLTIKNYGGNNMKFQLIGSQTDKKNFLAKGRITIDAFTNKIEEIKPPQIAIYSESVRHIMEKLHFGNYGGTSLKVIYFILALITCFVIITGVLIWLEARNKKSIPLKKRLFTNKVGHIYLAICLSLFPVTALSFVFVKLLPESYYDQKQKLIYYVFFLSWFFASFILRFLRDNYRTNKYTLVFGAVLGLLVPITNGMVTGNWIWKTYTERQYDILIIDLLWIFLSITAIAFAVEIKPRVQEKSATHINPIDYRKLKTLKKRQ